MDQYQRYREPATLAWLQSANGNRKLGLLGMNGNLLVATAPMPTLAWLQSDNGNRKLGLLGMNGNLLVATAPMPTLSGCLEQMLILLGSGDPQLLRLNGAWVACLNESPTSPTVNV